MDDACRRRREVQGLRLLREIAARITSLGAGPRAEERHRCGNRKTSGWGAWRYRDWRGLGRLRPFGRSADEGGVSSPAFCEGKPALPATYAAGAPLLPLPAGGAPSEPQRNGRHAPAPPKSPRLGTFYFERRCPGYPRLKEPSGDLWGEESPPVVARLRLAITRSVRFGHLDGCASAP
jgi:hypothetical protein